MVVDFLFWILPLQIFSVSIRNTWIELSSCLVLLIIIRSKLFRLNLVLSLVLALFLFRFLLSPYIPAYRFFSAIVWITIAMILYFCDFRRLNKCNLPDYRSVLIPAFIVSCLIIFDNSGRPSATFFEPSFCGLYLSASLAYGLYKFKFALTRQTIMIGIFAFFSVIAIYQTASFHAVSFFIGILFSISYPIFIRIKSIFKGKLRLLLLIFPISYLVFYISVASIDQFYGGRFSLDTSNISVLVWLHNLDLSIQSINYCSFLGCGLGSTGFWHPDPLSLTPNGLILKSFGLNLNLFDAYSLFFRLFMEAGILFAVLLLILVFKRIYSLSRLLFYLNCPEFVRRECQGMLAFASIYIFGAFIKEPLYSSPFFILPFFLFSLLRSTHWRLSCYRVNFQERLQ